VPSVAQPGQWFGPVTGLGLLGPAQPHGLSWAQPKTKYKNKKNRNTEK